MSEANARTLDTYNSAVDTYITNTAQETSGGQKQWLDKVVDGLDKETRVLEIGSAFGRDANYLESVGYKVSRTDGSIGFVEYLKSNGYDANVLDIISQRPKEKYGLILACAVFLHFSQQDFEHALKNVSESLEDNGLFAFSLKHGDGEMWTEDKMYAPRFFKLWREDQLIVELAKVGMVASDVSLLENDKWIHMIAKKHD